MILTGHAHNKPVFSRFLTCVSYFTVSGGGNNTTVGANFNGLEKEQTTKATIGLGNVTVGGTNIDEQAQFADLNRDAANNLTGHAC